MIKGCKTVEEYLERSGDWRPVLKALREIALAEGLEETVKWGAPCYTQGGRNVISLVAFRDYAGLWFHEAEALPDPAGVLQAAEGSKSVSMKQWRFADAGVVEAADVAGYLRRAAALVARPRKKQAAKRSRGPAEVPPELAAVLDGAKGARAAFEALTPGRQREYAAHVADAKREATRARRAEGCLEGILAGRGLHDRYRS